MEPSVVKIEEISNESDQGQPEHEVVSTKRLRWAEDVVDSVEQNALSNDPAQSQSQSTAGGADNSTTASSVNATSASSSKNEAITKPAPSCSFCRRHPAAVMMKASWNGKRQPLCMLHYYTTSAVHAEPHQLKVLDATLAEAQLKGLDHAAEAEGSNTSSNKGGPKLNVQTIFSEAFVQLQSELAQESLTIKQPMAEPSKRKNPRKLANDPLGMLHDLGRSKKRRIAPPLPVSAAAASSNKNKHGGGFIRPVRTPERLQKTQQQQAKLQAEQTARMERIAKTGAQNNNTTKKIDYTSKRKASTKRSIWNSVMDGQQNSTAPSKSKNSTSNSNSGNTNQLKVPNITFREIDLQVEGVTCSCGSTDIFDAGNVTSRNQCSKEEVWGGKDRIDEVILKFRCNDCGKNWQETG